MAQEGTESGRPTRTIRVGETDWNKAKRRAQREGTTMSAVLEAFAKGYGLGKINLPQTVVIYDTVPAQPVKTSDWAADR